MSSNPRASDRQTRPQDDARMPVVLLWPMRGGLTPPWVFLHGIGSYSDMAGPPREPAPRGPRYHATAQTPTCHQAFHRRMSVSVHRLMAENTLGQALCSANCRLYRARTVSAERPSEVLTMSHGNMTVDQKARLSTNGGSVLPGQPLLPMTRCDRTPQRPWRA